MDKATFHSHKEILEILGEHNIYSDLHIHYMDRYFEENPMSYPYKTDNSALLLLLEGEMKSISIWKYIRSVIIALFSCPHSPILTL